jgi:hypothetical protein
LLTVQLPHARGVNHSPEICLGRKYSFKVRRVADQGSGEIRGLCGGGGLAVGGGGVGKKSSARPCKAVSAAERAELADAGRCGSQHRAAARPGVEGPGRRRPSPCCPPLRAACATC